MDNNIITTGFKNVDDNIHFEMGNFMVVGSRSLHGKTSFVLNVAIHNAIDQNKKVGLYCSDAKKSHTKKRLDAIYSKIPLHEYIKNELMPLNDEQKNGLDEIVMAIKKNNILINDKFFSIESLVKRIEEDIEIYNFDLIVIDLLQLLNTTSISQERFVPINEISRTLKVLARKLDVAIIGVSTLNKAVDSREYPEPYLRDFKEAGALEDDCDIAILLSIPELYVKEQEQQKIALAKRYKRDELPELYKNEPVVRVLVRIAKHKGLPPKDLYLNFVKAFTRFEEIIDEKEEPFKNTFK